DPKGSAPGWPGCGEPAATGNRGAAPGSVPVAGGPACAAAGAGAGVATAGTAPNGRRCSNRRLCFFRASGVSCGVADATGAIAIFIGRRPSSRIGPDLAPRGDAGAWAWGAALADGGGAAAGVAVGAAGPAGGGAGGGPVPAGGVTATGGGDTTHGGAPTLAPSRGGARRGAARRH